MFISARTIPSGMTCGGKRAFWFPDRAYKMRTDAVNCAVTRCDSALSDLEKKEQTGIVLGTYQKCFHLLLNDGRLITVFGAGRQTMPMSLYTDASAENPFAAAPLEEGQRAAFPEGICLFRRRIFSAGLAGQK